MSIETEELIVVSMCAASSHANSSGEEDRMDEIHETINRQGNALGLRLLDIGFCDGQAPLVPECPMASKRGSRRLLT